MTDDSSGSPRAVVQPVQDPVRPSSGACREIDVSNPPDVPITSPPGGTLSGTRAREHTALPEKHHIALRHIHTLESRNAKLYEDNCRLVHAVNTLNDRLAFLGAPHNVQAYRLADMQEKLRASEAARALINQKYHELLQCTSAASAHRHVSEEMQAIRDAYASLDREYRLLTDKYARLKTVADASRRDQQQLQDTGECSLVVWDVDTERIDPDSASRVARDHVPVVRSELANTAHFRAHDHDQSRNSYPSPTSAFSSSSFQSLPGQGENHRRGSSESVMIQPSLCPRPTTTATTGLAHLPTPPPSAPLPMGQISPTGFPVHASVPVVSLPLPYRPQEVCDPRISFGPSALTQSQHLVQQGTPEQSNAAMYLHQRCVEITNTVSKEPVPSSKQISTPASPTSSPRPPKRLTSVSPGGERKKSRIEEESDRPATVGADTCPANRVPSPPASADPLNDPKLTTPDSSVRSYQDCVNLIFEKDANVENGVFCGLCLDRHEAKMIPEPPDVLVQPDFDSLVRHCMSVHPAVWNDLRRKA